MITHPKKSKLNTIVSCQNRCLKITSVINLCMEIFSTCHFIKHQPNIAKLIIPINKLFITLFSKKVIFLRYFFSTHHPIKH